MDNDKSVLYVGAFELPDKNAAAHRVVANGKIFRALGYTVYYFGVDKVNVGNADNNHKTVLDEGLFSYSFSYPKTIREAYDYIFGISKIRKLISEEFPKPPEIIVAYNYPSIALNNLRKFCSRKNIILLADSTEWYDKPLGNILYRTYINFDMFYRMKVVHPKLHGVVAISRYIYDYYTQRMKNVLLLPPLVDIKEGKWMKPARPNYAGYKLVYAGSQGKGLKDRFDRILKILSIIKETTSIEFQLNVVGITKDDFISIFGGAAFPVNGDSFVTFKGRLSHIQSLHEVMDADYTIFIRDNILRNTAGFPTKLVEALSCGTSVLTNSTSNISDFLKDGVNGFMLDDSSEEALIASLIKALSIGKDEIAEMKRKIIDSEYFDYNKYINNMKQFIEKVNENN